MTLADIQLDCRNHLGIGTTEKTHPAYCGGEGVVWANGIAEQCRYVNLVCERSLRYLDRREPKEKWNAMRKVQRRVKWAMKKPGFPPLIVIIGGAMLSWLFQRAFDFLWNWWLGNRSEAKVICGAMGPLDEDDLDDGDDADEGDSD